MKKNKWGRIINIASTHGQVASVNKSGYVASKHGMIGLTKSLAKEFASRSVTVNAVAPGFIETDMTSGLDERVRDAALKFIPLKRFGQPQDIAHMTSYLCSEEAGYVTGKVFTIDGGMVI